MVLPSLSQIRDAQAVVYRAMPATPQYSWPLLNSRLGTEAWIKHENHSPVGAFSCAARSYIWTGSSRRSRV